MVDMSNATFWKPAKDGETCAGKFVGVLMMSNDRGEDQPCIVLEDAPGSCWIIPSWWQVNEAIKNNLDKVVIGSDVLVTYRGRKDIGTGNDLVVASIAVNGEILATKKLLSAAEAFGG